MRYNRLPAQKTPRDPFIPEQTMRPVLIPHWMRQATRPLYLSLVLALLIPGIVVADQNKDPDKDKCSPEKWLKLESDYLKALSASDYGRLKRLKVEKQALWKECNRPITPGGSGPGGSTPTVVTGPGTPPLTTGPGIAPTAPGTPPLLPGAGGQPPLAGGPAGPKQPTTPATGPKPLPTDTGQPIPPVTSPPAVATPPGLSAEEKARKEEWEKREEFTERMIREQAALTEANTGPVRTLWNDFWSSVSSGRHPPPVKPLKPPSFEELLSRGDPTAIRLQHIRNQVRNGVPSQKQLEQIQALSRAAQQGQAASAVAIVESNATAADLAQAGELISKVGASVGQAAAQSALVMGGVMDPATAKVATTAIYEGLQHYNEGAVSIIGHSAVAVGSGYLGGAAGDKVGSMMGEAAQTVGGRVLQGAVGGAVGAASGEIGNKTVEGKEIKAVDVIRATTVGAVVGGAVKGGTTDIKIPVPDSGPGLSQDDVENIITGVIKPVTEAATADIGASNDTPTVQPGLSAPKKPMKLPDD